jgi:transposase
MQPNCWARYGQKGALIFAPLVVLPLLLVFVSVARAQENNHNSASRILQSVRPRRDSRSAAKSVRRQLASELLRDVRALNRRISDLDARIREEVEASGTALIDIFGVGPILAAKIIALVGDTRRFPTKGHFASYAGVAPVEVSSGEVVRHRLSLAGNRRLNHALHMIAINQFRYAGKGGVYYRKKIAEGKTHKEAMRCLKRRVSDAVFKRLTADFEEVRTAV